jgi:hypothetical protein
MNEGVIWKWFLKNRFRAWALDSFGLGYVSVTASFEQGMWPFGSLRGEDILDWVTFKLWRTVVCGLSYVKWIGVYKTLEMGIKSVMQFVHDNVAGISSNQDHIRTILTVSHPATQVFLLVHTKTVWVPCGSTFTTRPTMCSLATCMTLSGISSCRAHRLRWDCVIWVLTLVWMWLQLFC